MSARELVFPDGVHFTCSRCGDCCRGWNVALGPGEPERLRQLDWAGKEDELVGVEPATRVPTSAHPVLVRRPDGACVFLSADDRCLLHAHFGAESKPLTCRLYPFAFYPLGERIAVDVSFACRAVSEGSGAPLRERLPEWNRRLETTGAAPALHPFSARYRVSGDLLWELEHDLVTLLTLSETPMHVRVRAVSEFMRLGTTADPRTDAARKLRSVMVGGIPEQLRSRPLDPELTRMDKTQRAVFFHLLFLTSNPTPPELHALSGKERDRETRRRVQAAEGFRLPKARPFVDNRELETTFERIEATDAGALASPVGEHLLERYLVAKVIGQRFMREGEAEIAFLDAVPRLLLLYPMLVWTGKAFAAEEGRAEVELSHARRGLRLLDRAYGAVPLSALPVKQRKAWRFVLGETDLAVTAAAELLDAQAASEP